MNRIFQDYRTRPVILTATVVIAVVLGLVSYWFVAAQRARVFLYDHLGATPFDTVTASRYWMAGLVADGYLSVILMWVALVGLSRGRRWLPAPDRVMSVAAGPLAAGVLVVTARLGAPPLPLRLATLVAVTALAGAYLALWTAFTLQQRRWASLWPALDGVALVPLLTLTQVVELPGRGISISPALAWEIVGASLAFGVVWRVVIAWVLRRGGVVPVTAWDALRAGATLSYVALPTLHHIIATPPGYKYITTAGNFMARNPWLLLATWLAAVALVVGTERLREGYPARVIFT